VRLSHRRESTVFRLGSTNSHNRGHVCWDMTTAAEGTILNLSTINKVRCRAGLGVLSSGPNAGPASELGQVKCGLPAPLLNVRRSFCPPLRAEAMVRSLSRRAIAPATSSSGNRKHHRCNATASLSGCPARRPVETVHHAMRFMASAFAPAFVSAGKSFARWCE
jgi:hypothetical protein